MSARATRKGTPWVRASSALLLLTLVSAIAVPTRLPAQDACVPTDSLMDWWGQANSLAKRYAPVYLFEKAEDYWPTMPYWTAFDGDFSDTVGMAPTWNYLNTLYLDDLYDKRDLAAIFYRVRPLKGKEVADIWSYLISDEQAWKRRDFGTDSLETVLRAEKEFVSIEFYAYYLNDVGLIGHRYDTEFVYVLAPRDTVLAKQFRIVVGGGHTQRVPNNVLVLGGRSVTPDPHPYIIVELGDHSSAPDVPPLGFFVAGLDANWHAYDVWGTRDTQAAAGLGALGRYEPWMTFPRHREDVLVPPFGLGSVEASAINSSLDNAFGDGPAHSEYALIAAEPLDCAFRELEETPPRSADDSLISRVEAWFTLADRFSTVPLGSPFQLNGFKHRDEETDLTDPEKAAAIDALRGWNQGLPVSVDSATKIIPPEKFLPWESEHYTKSPTRALKPHLFRPVGAAMKRLGHWLDLVNVWATLHSGQAVLLQSGFEVPAFWLPFRLPGYLEAHAGLYYSCDNLFQSSCFGRNSFAASLLHTNDYRANFTWYVRVSWIPERAVVDRNPDVTDWLFGGGMSSTAFGPFRIRLGLSADVTSNGPKLDTTRWELIVSPLKTLFF